jgi:MscS family membrane protein
MHCKSTSIQIKMWIILVLGMAVNVVPLKAQEADLSLRSPYHTINAFLYYQEPDSYNPQTSALTLHSNESTAEKINKARQLKMVLDGGGYFIHLSKLPRETDYVDSTSNSNIYVLFPDRLPEVYVERIDGKWQFSAHTVDMIPQLYERTFPFGLSKLLEMLPKSSHRNFLGIEVWKLLALLIAIVFFIVIFYVLAFLLRMVLSVMANRYIKHLRGKSKLKTRLTQLFAVYVCLWALTLALPVLLLPAKLLSVLLTLITVTRTILMVFILLRVVEILFLYAKDYTSKTASKMDDQLFPIFERVVVGLVVIGGILGILQTFSVNITALIAGLSIGGLALALAAQDTVKNFIGSAMIFIDKPFQIGDSIQQGAIEGTVEEVGFRSTRIRNVDKSLISVPNGQMADATIVNLGLRPDRRMQLNIGVMYNTPAEKLEIFLQGLRQLIEKHPHASKQDYVVRLHNLSPSSMDILFRVYLAAATFGDELSFREDLLFGIIKLAKELGVEFAFPSTSLYIEQTEAPASETEPNQNNLLTMQAFLEQFEKKMRDKFRETEDHSI